MEMVEALALVSGHVEEEILKSKMKKSLHFNDHERIRIAKIGKLIGLKVLREIACIVRPETILKWSRSPNLNAFAERWVVFIKPECISELIFFGEKSLLTVLKEYTIHYHQERNHQSKNNCLLFLAQDSNSDKKESEIACRSRLGSVLKYYYRSAA
jgi:hypothetical protein